MTPEEALAALVTLVEPPVVPTRPDMIDWDDFARRNGFEAPVDYRLLMERYGTGGFGAGALAGGWLYTLDPFEATASLVDLSDWDRRNSRGMQRRFPDQFPGWPMWPEESGLLPWANSADGDLIGWWTVGEPNRWGIRFFGRDIDYEQFSFGAAEFIFRLLTGRLGAAGLDSRFGSLEPAADLRFFAMPRGAMRGRWHPLETVTVVFAGLTAVVDPAAVPSAGDHIIQSWRVDAQQAGFHIDGIGTHRAGWSDPLHHEISGSFDPAISSIAKDLVADLSRRLGVQIREIRNLEYERVWEDLTVSK